MKAIQSIRGLCAGGILAAAMLAAAPVHADLRIVTDLTGIGNHGAAGSSENLVLPLSIGATGMVINEIYWNLELTTVGASWLSQATILVKNSAGAGYALQPGWGDDRSGTESYVGGVDLTALGMQFPILADGLLSIEFYDSFDDHPGVDSFYNRGTLALLSVVPEPSTQAMLLAGFLGLFAAATRRRAAVRPRRAPGPGPRSGRRYARCRSTDAACPR